MNTNWRVNDYFIYAYAIREAERQYHLPENLLGRLLFQQSGFEREKIVGYRRNTRVGSAGIAMFNPDTAKKYGLVLFPFTHNGEDCESYLPIASIVTAALHLSLLKKRMGSWETALLAFNWGDDEIAAWLKNRGNAVNIQSSEFVQKILADVPLHA